MSDEKFVLKCDKCGPLDYCLIDGYHVGERLLEGIDFEVYFGENGKVSKVVVPRDAMPYFEQLNQEMWLERVRMTAEEEYDIAKCPKCGGEVDLPAAFKPRTGPPPKQVRALTGPEFLEKMKKEFDLTTEGQFPFPEGPLGKGPTKPKVD